MVEVTAEVMEVATAAVTTAVDILAGVIAVAAGTAVVIMVVAAAFISADGIMAAAILLPAIFTAGRRISVRSPRAA